MSHGICLIKMVFDQSKNHLIIVLTGQNDWSKILVEMINQKYYSKMPTQAWSKSTQPNHNGQVQNDLKVFFTLVQNGSFFTKIYSKKLGILIVLCPYLLIYLLTIYIPTYKLNRPIYLPMQVPTQFNLLAQVGRTNYQPR